MTPITWQPGGPLDMDAAPFWQRDEDHGLLLGQPVLDSNEWPGHILDVTVHGWHGGHGNGHISHGNGHGYGHVLPAPGAIALLLVAAAVAFMRTRRA